MARAQLELPRAWTETKWRFLAMASIPPTLHGARVGAAEDRSDRRTRELAAAVAELVEEVRGLQSDLVERIPALSGG